VQIVFQKTKKKNQKRSQNKNVRKKFYPSMKIQLGRCICVILIVTGICVAFIPKCKPFQIQSSPKDKINEEKSRPCWWSVTLGVVIILVSLCACCCCGGVTCGGNDDDEYGAQQDKSYPLQNTNPNPAAVPAFSPASAPPLEATNEQQRLV
jgi:hypothetical protein